jgi:hypothetical protein
MSKYKRSDFTKTDPAIANNEILIAILNELAESNRLKRTSRTENTKDEVKNGN